MKDIILCTTYHNFRKFQINASVKYNVIKLKENSIVVSNIYDDENTELEIPRDIINTKFTSPYCFTIDAIQGLTIDEPTTLFDIQCPYACNYKYIYTMVSRMTSLSLLTIFKYSDQKLKMLNNAYYKQRIIRNIEMHELADEEAGRIYTDEDYVNFDWVMEKLKEQDYKSTSGEILTIETISIDRKDNKKAHTKDNCQLMTWLENVSKSDSE